MKRFFTLTAVALTFAAVTSSCLDNNGKEPENKATYNYGPVFNTITDKTTGDVYYNDDTEYQLTIDYVNSTLSVTTTDLKVSSGSQKHTIQISPMPVKIQTGTVEQGVQSIIVSAENAYAITAPTQLDITDLSLAWTDRAIGGAYNPLIGLSYTINDTYDVVVMPNTATYFGTVTSTNAMSGDAFTANNIKTVVKFNPLDGTAAIDLNGIQFVGAMPALNMTFPGIKFDAVKSTYTLASEALTPTIKDTPYPNYPITNLKAEASLATGKMTLSFTCTPMGMGAYNVTAEFGPVSIEE